MLLVLLIEETQENFICYRQLTCSEFRTSCASVGQVFDFVVRMDSGIDSVDQLRETLVLTPGKQVRCDLCYY